MFLWNSLAFFYDTMDVGNLISTSSTFSKSGLTIWKFSVPILLKPGMENSEHYFASVWDECNCAVVWALFGTEMKTDLFQSCGHCWVFQICWHIECSTFTASSFRIWNSSLDRFILNMQLEPSIHTTVNSIQKYIYRMYSIHHLWKTLFPFTVEHQRYRG